MFKLRTNVFVRGIENGVFLYKNTRKVAKALRISLIGCKLDKKHFITLFIILY